MKQLEVQIMGQSYLLGCPPGGEQRLLEAVEKVDTAMCRIRDAGKVKAEASNTSQAVAGVDMKLLSGPAHNDWMSFLGPIQSSLKEIEYGQDIEAQRKAFSTLSENLYKSIKAFGLGGTEVFYDYCPMAFDNEGAYWLSD